MDRVNREIKKSICFILPGWITKTLGGAEWQTYLLSEELVKRNYQVTVITAKSDSAGLNKKYINSKIHYKYYPSTNSNFIQFLLALLIIAKQRSYYYYVRTDNRVFRAACCMVSRVTGRKTIYAIAGDDELDYSRFKVNRNSKFPVRIIRFIDYGIANLMTRRSEHGADLIIAQTFYQQKILKERKKLDSVVIRNSFVFSRSEKIKIIKENIILWIGNFSPVKQPEFFVNIANNFTTTGYEFIMIGETGNYKFERLPDNLVIKGLMLYNEVEQYLSRAKFLINTSKTEGFPNTFPEAWSNNVFVLSLNSNPDNFLDGNLGYCANGDNALLIHKIDEFISDNTFDNSKIAETFMKIKSDFDLEKNVERFIDVIRSLKV